MRALLIANAADADPGLVGERFRDHGFAFAECHRERPGEWPALDGIDLVVQLGSDWSVYWPQVAAEVRAECELIGAAHRAGVPVFGICFGAQVITATLGGHVAPAPEDEVGWYSIDSTVDRIAGGPWMQWHYDRCEGLPVGAELLATSPAAPQAFRLGRTFATQFHPEVDVSIVDRWLGTAGSAELERLGPRVAGIAAATPASVRAAAPNTARLVDWFLDEVAGRR